jgi:hypothetical protein
MTISTARVSRLTVSRIVTLAWRQAGLLSEYQNATAEQGTYAREILDTIVSELAGEGVIDRAMEPTVVTLADGIAVYDLPEYAINTQGSGMWTPLGGTTELLVTPMTRDTWNEIAAKSAEGVPRFYWCERVTESVRVRIWPTPAAAEAGSTIRFFVHCLNYGATVSGDTAPLDEYWTQALIWRLAADLAVAQCLPLGRCQLLAETAKAKMKVAMATGRQDVAIQMVIGES